MQNRDFYSLDNFTHMRDNFKLERRDIFRFLVNKTARVTLAVNCYLNRQG